MPSRARGEEYSSCCTEERLHTMNTRSQANDGKRPTSPCRFPNPKIPAALRFSALLTEEAPEVELVLL
jgi:hypothetical protein